MTTDGVGGIAPCPSRPVRLQNPTAAPVWSVVPRELSLEITGRCQLRCAHCFNDSGPDVTEELDLAAIVRILDEAAGWGLHTVRISGGEPTLHRRFEDVVSACADRGVAVDLNTNGIYSPARLQYLRRAPIERFLVSVDGLPERNDAIRGPGSFRRTFAACRELIAAGQRVLLCMHVSTDTVDDVDGLIDLAVELGCDLKVSPIRPVGRAAEVMRDRTATPDAYRAVVEKVTSRRATSPGIRLSTDFDVLSDHMRDPAARLGEPEDAVPGWCPAGRTRVSVGYDGRIYPCAFFASRAGEFSGGSIHHGTVEQAWRSAAFTPLRVHTKAPACLRCPHYRRECPGGCPALAHFALGVLDAVDPTCFVAASTPPASDDDT